MPSPTCCHTRPIWIAVAALIGVAPGCVDPEPPPTPNSTSNARPAAERFSKDRAWQHLEKLVGFGPRAPGFAGHAAAEVYITGHLQAAGFTVTAHRFEYLLAGAAEPTEFTNLVAHRLGRPGRPAILLGSHYDTRPWADEDPSPHRRNQPIAGANDGGSGTAILLEIATVLAERPPDLEVDLLFFDGEEGARGRTDYCVGSRRLAADWATLFGDRRPAAAVIIDMVGDRDLGIRHDPTAVAANPWLDRHIWAVARERGQASFIDGDRTPLIDDHTPLLELGIPATLVIDYDYQPWHTVEDTLDKCSPESLEAVGSTLLAALFDRPLPVEARR